MQLFQLLVWSPDILAAISCLRFWNGSLRMSRRLPWSLVTCPYRCRGFVHQATRKDVSQAASEVQVLEQRLMLAEASAQALKQELDAAQERHAAQLARWVSVRAAALKEE